MGIILGSYGDHLGIIWGSVWTLISLRGSCGGHFVIIWASFWAHMGTTLKSCAGHVDIIWEYHMSVTLG
eukprot:9798684-Karenia_brevis.AAC.1